MWGEWFTFNTWLLILLIIVVVSLISRTAIGLSRSFKTAALLLGLRLVVLGVISALFYHIFFSEDFVADEKDDDDKDKLKLALVADFSQSMQLRDKETVRRSETRNEFIKAIEEKVEAYEDIELEKRFLAGSLAMKKPESDDSTELFRLINNYVQREKIEGLIVVSDGIDTASTVSGAPIGKILSQKGVSATIFSCGNENLYDFSVEIIKGEPVNPEVIEVTVNCENADLPQKLPEIELKLNGTIVEKRPLLREAQQTITFRPGEVAFGSHFFEAVIPHGKNEVTSLNNQCGFVFKKKSKLKNAEKVVLVYDKPQRDVRALARFLRDKYPENFQIFTKNDAKLGTVTATDVRWLIAIDIQPADIPGKLISHLSNEETKSMLTVFADKNLDKWSVIYGKTASKVALQNSAKSKVREWTCRLSGVDNSRLVNLECERIWSSDSFTSTGECMLGIKRPMSVQPIFWMDKAVDPKFSIVFTDVSWRWRASADSATRQLYSQLWNSFSNSLLQQQKNKHGLIIEATFADPDQNEVLVDVYPADEKNADKIGEVSLKVAHSAQPVDLCLNETPVLKPEELVVNLSPVDVKTGKFSGKVSLPEYTGCSRLTANATVEGKNLTSEQLPIYRQKDMTELKKVVVNPQNFENLFGTKPVRLEISEESMKEIDQFLAKLQRPGITPKIRQRRVFPEILLTIILMVVAALEWYIERRLIAE